MSSDRTKETMFRITWGEKIEEVEVVKKTKCFVTIAYLDWNKKRCESRESVDKFYPTWEAAHQSLIQKYENEMKWCKEKLHRLNSRLGEIKGMKL